MRNLVYDSGPIQAAFESNQDATALALLNTATETVVVHSLVDVDVIVTAESESFAGDFLQSLDAQMAALNASIGGTAVEDKRLASILQVYRTQLAGDGIDLTNTKVRNKIGDALQAQGWNNAKRNRVLNLGYVLRSKPQVQYGRDAVQADLDAIRADDIRIELEQDFAAGLNAHINAHLATGDRAAVIAGLTAMAAELGA